MARTGVPFPSLCQVARLVTLTPGTHFGKYRIVRLLGKGGMADVYEAEDAVIGRRVALKVLPRAFARDEDRAKRFAKEIRACAQLHHPNIVSVFDVGELDGLHFYSMAVLSGGDLKGQIEKGPIPPEAVQKIALDIAGALAYAHGKGFIHRDVKPENILFHGDGSAVLTDFGIARTNDAHTKLTATGLSIGTPHYMSPEQARGKPLDQRSDLYSLGVVIYEMLTGRTPFNAGDSLAIAYQHVNEAAPELPPHLVSWQPLLDALLAKEPADRVASASDLIGQLKDWDEAREGTATRPIPRSATLQSRDLGKTVLVDRGSARHSSNAKGTKQRYTAKAIVGVFAGSTAAIFLLAMIWHASHQPVMPGGASGATSLSESREGGAERTHPISVLDGTQEPEPLEPLDQDGPITEAVPSISVDRSRTIAMPESDVDVADEFSSSIEMQERSDHIDAYESISRIDRELGEQRDLISVVAQAPLVSSSLSMPKAVLIASGTFAMGTESSMGFPDEQPARTVHVGKDFFMTKWPVTIGLFKNFVEQTDYVTDAERGQGCRVFKSGRWELNETANWRNPGYQVQSDFPVTCVSWNDAKAYAAWLSEKSGTAWVLPSEAQWEYAANLAQEEVNCQKTVFRHDASSGCPQIPDRPDASLVARTRDDKPQQMVGLVWEWVEDCFNADYRDAPQHDGARLTGDCDHRMLRGGSWTIANRQYLRPQTRAWHPNHGASSDLGFRLVRL
ncbi:MAG: bifunctional serine/threonine-protein kinase/formylglycine-generating enzyme family protein [Wenzhouxiangella sp.]